MLHSRTWMTQRKGVREEGERENSEGKIQAEKSIHYMTAYKIEQMKINLCKKKKQTHHCLEVKV